MAKTLVRNAVTADFSTLLSIDKGAFPPGIAYDFAELSYFMKRRGAHTLVAEHDGEIVGFLLMEIAAYRRTAILVTLDIIEKHRRRGFATTLLKRSETILWDHSVVRYELQVDVQNTTAQEFYGKHGFEVVRTLPKYYANGNDAYLMTKQLV